MTDGTRDTSISFTALYGGACIGVILGAVYVTFLTSPSSAFQWWSTASGFLIGGLLFLTVAAVAIGLPVWAYARRVRVGNRRLLLILGATALAAGLIIGIAIGLITNQILNSVGVLMIATLWCCTSAFVLAGPLSASRQLRWTALGLAAVLAFAAGITLLTHLI